MRIQVVTLCITWVYFPLARHTCVVTLTSVPSAELPLPFWNPLPCVVPGRHGSGKSGSWSRHSWALKVPVGCEGLCQLLQLLAGTVTRPAAPCLRSRPVARRHLCCTASVKFLHSLKGGGGENRFGPVASPTVLSCQLQVRVTNCGPDRPLLSNKLSLGFHKISLLSKA